ncbi:MFS transporter [Acetobacter fallax]|uniref:MFS transporter n=1 Tax=Acetobacter fallax TaxID=1737473 RepID=A0ABX0KBK2_9PROT|nr:MFS transporter [Acetobacter fallax]NHO33350.1 MFS transporter [Acetobacter fallax]NHO36970.1 MFS transporter [Acetobacter fallax]
MTGPDLRPGHLSPAMTLIFALVCGVTVANIYYAQSLVGPIAHDLRIKPEWAGAIITLTQLGYGSGLFFLVSLGDIIENRRLILMLTAGLILSLAGVVLSTSPEMFLLSSFAVGVCSVGSQVLVPLATYLSPPAMRGRVIGNIMGGLITGIMLSRPLASFLAGHFGWRAVFALSDGLMIVAFGVLWWVLPPRQPHPRMGYGALLGSTLRLLAVSHPLQRRVAYQGVLFGVFNMFWTGVPLMLHDRFGMSQQAIAAFALAGAGGALSAPFAGRVADRGYTRLATGIAIGIVLLASVISGWAASAGALLILALAAIALDGAAQANQILSQRVVYSLSDDARGRLNAAYMTVVFLGGAAGSTLGAWTYFRGGWGLTSLVGFGLSVVILLVYATEFWKKSL